MRDKLFILHEYGAPSHFAALYHLNDKNKYFNQVIPLEFSLFRQIARGVIRKRPHEIKKAFKNIYYLISLLFKKNKLIIIGAAPYDLFVFYLNILKKKHNVIYFSSWPYWDFSNYPKKIYFKPQVRYWEYFLTNIQGVAVTDYVNEGLRRYTSNIVTIPHSINPNVFNSSNTKRDKNKLRILFVGRLNQQKGVDIILTAIEESKNENIEWFFVGNGELGHQVDIISKQNNNVKNHGFVSNKKELSLIYKSCDILLLPSRKEKKWEELFGIVLIEAMACGVVPISSNCVGPSTIIEDSKNGFIVKEDKHFQYLEKIQYLESNREVLNEVSQNAIKTVNDKYTIEVNSTKWEKVIKENLL
jgi:glycosyltransferase involved in cell wall biosynthesis